MKNQKPNVKAVRRVGLGSYKFGFSSPEDYVYKPEKGLNENVINKISEMKSEPDWMRDFRLKSYQIFLEKKMPAWGGDLSRINFDDIYYYIKPTLGQEKSWDDVPADIKKTFDRLGIPQAEKEFLSGVKAQYESEVVYGSLLTELADQGVIFLDTDSALKEYPEFFKEWFGKIIPPHDNKFAALNSSVWSGGSFVYIPKGVHVKRPLQAYFRINARNMGQFERTLIIADEGSFVHYVEGCTAPVYSSDSLHAAVVEIVVKKNARVRYTTIQNWSGDVYNLVTKRSRVEENGVMEWVDGNLGCLTGDTKIFTPTSVNNIKDIESGENVYSVQSDFSVGVNKIIGKKYSGRQEVFLLETVNKRSIKATGNHPFLSIRKSGQKLSLSWLPLKSLEKDDYVAVSGVLPDHGLPYTISYQNKKSVKRKVWTPQETDNKLLWFLGFYLGDGYCDGARLYIAVPPTDRSYRRVEDYIKSILQLPCESKGSVVRVNSADLVDYIKFLGFTGGARTKQIPSWIYSLPVEQKKAFIEGYIDADGHYRKNHKNISITSVNRDLLESVKDLAISCGLNPSKISKWTRVEKKPLGKEVKEYTHYFLYFHEGILNEDLYFSRISKIEPAGEEDTYDLEIKDAHNFLANGFYVHNSRLTMKYPSCYLIGKGAHGELLSIAYADKGQHQDTGGKMIHVASNTSSKIISKSISLNGGRTSYRGMVQISESAKNAKSKVECDALILDDKSASDTFPVMRINESSATVEHEATVSKVGQERLFYLMSRGLTEDEAMSLIVNGFIEPIVKELPLEYAVELNRLIELGMEGSVG